MSKAVSTHEALVYIMVLVAASDAKMTDNEFRAIGDVVRSFAVFRGFDADNLVHIAQDAGELMSGADGLHDVINVAAASVPTHLVETAYACAVEVAAADDHIVAEELRVLDLVRSGLKVDRLAAAAIVRSARVRHTPL